jgi:hypothetical protein
VLARKSVSETEKDPQLHVVREVKHCQLGLVDHLVETTHLEQQPDTEFFRKLLRRFEVPDVDEILREFLNVFDVLPFRNLRLDGPGDGVVHFANMIVDIGYRPVGRRLFPQVFQLIDDLTSAVVVVIDREVNT